MTNRESAIHTVVKPLAAGQRVYASTVAYPAEHANVVHVSECFVASTGYAWRSGFREPTLDDVSGVGAKLLPIDF
jgi:hypothetical protein